MLARTPKAWASKKLKYELILVTISVLGVV
jgi:hypothetical protein